MELFLHIGTEKTATTLLQKWLYANRDALSAQGVFLSTKLDLENNRKLVAYFQSAFDQFHRRHRIANKAAKARFFAGFLDEFSAEIAEAARTHHTMIVTSEHFHSRLIVPENIAQLRDFLAAHFATIRVVCYLREQSELRRSLYSTAMRAGHDLPIETFLIDEDESSPYFNYDLFLSKWAAAFGEDAMVVRVFDRFRFIANDIRQDFLSILPNTIEAAALDFAIQSANESLGYLQARAFRAINRCLPLYPDEGGVDQVNYQYKRLVRYADKIPDVPILDTNQQQFSERFTASNQRVSARYFDGKPLFGSPSRGQNDQAPPAASAQLAGDAVEALTESFVVGTQTHLLSRDDGHVLRDAAMVLETSPEHRGMALALMRLAAKARPEGYFIKQKIAEWESEAD